MKNTNSYQPGGALDTSTVRGIIRTARGSRNQEDFAREIGATQPLLSLYERGKVNPPAVIIDRCLSILKAKEQSPNSSVRALVRAVETGLTGPQNQELRQALLVMIESLGLVSSKQVGKNLARTKRSRTTT